MPCHWTLASLALTLILILETSILVRRLCMQLSCEELQNASVPDTSWKWAFELSQSQSWTIAKSPGLRSSLRWISEEVQSRRLLRESEAFSPSSPTRTSP